MGSVWRRLGAEVTVVEFLDRITAGHGWRSRRGDAAHAAEAGLRRSASAPRSTGGEARGKTASRSTSSRRPAARARSSTADAVLVSIGRRPYTEGLGLETVGVAARQSRPRRRRSRITPTNVPGIYAIGDVIAGPMLAHKAEDEGVARRRNPRRASAGHVELRRHSGRDLHLPRSRLGRQDRGGAEGRRRRVQGRQIPVHRQRAAPAPMATPKASSKSSPTPRPTACSACTSSAPMPAR